MRERPWEGSQINHTFNECSGPFLHFWAVDFTYFIVVFSSFANHCIMLRNLSVCSYTWRNASLLLRKHDCSIVVSVLQVREVAKWVFAPPISGYLDPCRTLPPAFSTLFHKVEWKRWLLSSVRDFKWLRILTSVLKLARYDCAVKEKMRFVSWPGQQHHT